MGGVNAGLERFEHGGIEAAFVEREGAGGCNRGADISDIGGLAPVVVVVNLVAGAVEQRELGIGERLRDALAAERMPLAGGTPALPGWPKLGAKVDVPQNVACSVNAYV